MSAPVTEVAKRRDAANRDISIIGFCVARRTTRKKERESLVACSSSKAVKRKG